MDLDDEELEATRKLYGLQKADLEKAIDFLEKIAKEYKTFGDLDNPEFEDGKKIYTSIKTVLEAFKELQKENKSYRSQLNGAFDRGFIPKKKIEDEISQINDCIYDYSSSEVVEILQELLED